MKLEIHSGGARGSDYAWGYIGKDIIKSPNEITCTHYYHGQKTPYGNKLITQQDYEQGIIAIDNANKVLKRHTAPYLSLLVRNYIPVREAQAVFAIVRRSPLKPTDGVIDGGTAWGIQMAKDCGKPIWLFDQRISYWKEWDDKFGWCICDCPILTPKSACIGTRVIEESGIEAIKNIYHKTQSSWNNILK